MARIGICSCSHIKVKYFLIKINDKSILTLYQSIANHPCILYIKTQHILFIWMSIRKENRSQKENSESDILCFNCPIVPPNTDMMTWELRPELSFGEKMSESNILGHHAHTVSTTDKSNTEYWFWLYWVNCFDSKIDTFE